jgi:predicted nucleic acid-binding protein
VSPIKVVDASAIVAWLFKEPEQAPLAQELGAMSLAAPRVLPFEVANACIKKIRSRPGDRMGLLASFEVFFEIEIDLMDVDYADALRVAHERKLSFYDASYLWLARRLDAELITLDQRLADAAMVLRRRDG